MIGLRSDCAGCNHIAYWSGGAFECRPKKISDHIGRDGKPCHCNTSEVVSKTDDGDIHECCCCRYIY